MFGILSAVAANKATSYYEKLIYEELANEFHNVMNKWQNNMEVYEARSNMFAVFGGITFALSAATLVLFIISKKKAVKPELEAPCPFPLNKRLYPISA